MTGRTHQHAQGAADPALDELLNQALDAHAAGDQRTAAAHWDRIEREHGEHGRGALSLRDALHALAKQRPAIDVTQSVLARLDASIESPAGARSDAAGAAASMAPPAKQRGLRFPTWLSHLRISPVAAAFVLGAGVTAALMLAARPGPRASAPAAPAARAAQSVALEGLPGVEDVPDALPLRLGNTDKYMQLRPSLLADVDLRAKLARRDHAVRVLAGNGAHAYGHDHSHDHGHVHAHAEGHAHAHAYAPHHHQLESALVALPTAEALIIDAPPGLLMGTFGREAPRPSPARALSPAR